MKKKALAFLLSILMLVSVFPVSALADEISEGGQPEENITETEPAAEEQGQENTEPQGETPQAPASEDQGDGSALPSQEPTATPEAAAEPTAEPEPTPTPVPQVDRELRLGEAYAGTLTETKTGFAFRVSVPGAKLQLTFSGAVAVTMTQERDGGRRTYRGIQAEDGTWPEVTKVFDSPFGSWYIEVKILDEAAGMLPQAFSLTLAQAPEATATPEPTAEPTVESSAEPMAEPTAEPTTEPDDSVLPSDSDELSTEGENSQGSASSEEESVSGITSRNEAEEDPSAADQKDAAPQDDGEGTEAEEDPSAADQEDAAPQDDGEGTEAEEDPSAADQEDAAPQDDGEGTESEEAPAADQKDAAPQDDDQGTEVEMTSDPEVTPEPTAEQTDEPTAEPIAEPALDPEEDAAAGAKAPAKAKGNGNGGKSYSIEGAGTYTFAELSGRYKGQDKPGLSLAFVTAGEDLTVLEAWNATDLTNKNTASLTLTVTALPELLEGETLALYTHADGALLSPVMAITAPGQAYTLAPEKGLDGLALVKVTDEIQLTEGMVFDPTDYIELSGKMPKNAVVDIVPVYAPIDGQDVLASYDIKIYANANQRSKGKTWQPAGDKVTVRLRDEAFGSDTLNIYHTADGGAPELVATAQAADGELSFEAEGFSVWSVTGGSLIDRVVSAVRNALYTDTVYENDEIVLSGKLPRAAIIEANKVDVAIEGETTLVAYDIKIYANAIAKALNIPWQPTDGDITVRVKSGVLENKSELHVYHMADENAAPELVATVDAQDSAVTFQAKSFSVYVVGEEADRIFYTFFNGSEVLAKEYITEIGNFYDPGVTPEYGQTFIGWAYDISETNEANMFTFDRLKTDLEAKLSENPKTWSDGYEINVYAKFKEAYYLRYMVMDGEGNVGVLGNSQSVRKDAANKTVTVDCEYSGGTDEHFEGWLDVADPTAPHVYQNGEPITLDRHIDLYAKIEGRYWLVFNANTTGATFTGPQLIYGDYVTSQPKDPTKKGYLFTGWNTKADGTGDTWLTVTYGTDGTPSYSNSRFGGTITADITLYAQWEGAPNSYTVIYWKQKASADPGDQTPSDYDYVESQTISVGVYTDDVTALPSGYNTKGTTTDTSSNYYQTEYGWTDWDSSVTVSANGDTVVNVYYNRKAYHLYFQVQGYGYSISTSNQEGYYYIPNGSGGYTQVYLYRNDGKWYRTRSGWWPPYTYSNEYTGDRYTYSYDWQTIKDIYAVYGHDVSGEFPIQGTNGVTYGAGNRWAPQANNQGWSQVMVVVDSMPNETVYFHLDTSNNATKYIKYFVEALPGQTADLTYNGVDYVQHGNTIEASYGFVTEEDKLTITGFEEGSVIAIGGTRESDRNVLTLGGSPARYRSGNTDATYVNFLYTRKTNSIDFKSEGANVTASSTQTVTNVPYGAKITDYLPADPTNGKDGYYFAGWYQDQDCQVPLDDTVTMPADASAVFYAKWDTYRVRVVFVPNCTDFWFDNNQKLTFRVNYGEEVSFANVAPGVAKRPGYKLSGWYYTPDFQPGTEIDTTNPLPINVDTDGVNMNYQTSEDWTRYGDNDGQHQTVRGILKFYARWQLDLKEGVVYFLYEVEDGYCVVDGAGNSQTVVPVDSTGYDLGATLQIAEAPTGYISGVDFSKWMVLNSSGGATSVTYSPGDTITLVEAEWADKIAVKTVTDGDGHVGTMKYVRLRAQFTSQGDKTTTVVFHGNGGAMDDGTADYTKVYALNAPLELSEQSAAFTRPHFSLTSWNTAADGSGPSFALDADLYANNEELEADEANHLYAIWQADIEIVATGTTEEVIYDAAEHTNETYEFTYLIGGEEKTLAQLNAMGIQITIAAAGWPAATGTEKGTYTADDLTDTQLAALITIDDSVYRSNGGMLNIKRVYMPAKLIIRDLKLTMEKTISGDFIQRNQPYTFTLVSVEDMATGTFDMTITRVIEGTTTEKTIAIGGTFWLREGDTAEIVGLPKGKDVVFSESAGNYVTSWTLDGGTAVTGVQITVNLTDDARLVVDNHYNPPAPTGVRVAVAPFGLMVLMGGLLAGLGLAGRRRRREGGDAL